MTQKLALIINGMHCDACVRRVTNALQQIDGATVDDVAVGSAHLSFNPEQTSQEKIAQAINRIGFHAVTQE